MSDKVKEEIIKNLRTVFDPEISINIYDLGLIYNIDMNILQTQAWVMKGCHYGEGGPVENFHGCNFEFLLKILECLIQFFLNPY